MTYSIDIRSTLMQNHVAGRPLPKQETLAVSTAGDGSPVMFALDDAQTLTVSLRSDTSTTGWAKVDLGAQLGGLSGLGATPLVQNFAVVQDADGSTWIALAASDQALGASTIFLSRALPQTMTVEDWQGFAALVTARSAPPMAWFTALVLGSGDDLDGPPAAVGIAALGGQLQQYYFNPDPDDRSWDCVPIAAPPNASACVAATTGRIADLGRGLYGLYVISGKTMNLTFTAFPADGTPPPQPKTRTLLLPASYAPTSTAALAALPVRDGLTELYLSGAGLQRYSLSLQKDDKLGQPIQLFDKTLFVATEELAVSCDPEATAIDVWAINYYEQLVHTVGTVQTTDTAGLDVPRSRVGDEPVYDWQPALTLGQEVTAIAGYRAPLPVPDDEGAAARHDGHGYPRDGHGNAHPGGRPRRHREPGAPTAGPTTQAAVAYAVKPDILNVMLKDDDAELWQTQAVTFQAPDTGTELYTYTTQISVTDADGCGADGVTVRIRPTTDVPALVNGKYYALLAAVPKEAVTDPYGCVTIVLETTDLVAPTYTVTLTDDDGTVASRTEDPAKDVTAFLKTVTTGEQIYDAPLSDGSGTVIESPTPEQIKACDDAATGISQMMDLYTEMSAQGLRAGRPRPRPHTVGHDRHGRPIAGPRVPDGPEPFLVRCHPGGCFEVLRGAEVGAALPPQGLWDLVKSAGDLLWAAINGSGQVLSYGLQLVDGVYNFVIDIGGQLLAFVVQIAEQALSAVGFIVKQLGLLIRDIVNWLGFVFDWSAVLDTHRVLRHVYGLGFGYIAGQTATYQGYVDDAFQAAIDRLDPDGLLPVHTDLPPYSSPARDQPGAPAPDYSSPQANWARQKLIDNSAGSSYQQVTPPDPGDSLEDLNPDWVATAQDVADNLETQIGAAYASQDWAGMGTLFLNLLGAGALAAGQGLADAVFGALQDVVTSFLDMAQARLDIPLITWVYEDVICGGDGSKLTLLDAAALLTAVPATVSSRAALGTNLFGDELAQTILKASTWQEMIDGIIAMPPTEAAALMPPGTPDADIPALYAGAIFLMASGACRGVSAVLDLIALYKGVDAVGKPLKLMADWGTFYYSLVNASLVTSVRFDDSDRERLDWAFVLMPLLPCISASFLFAYFLIYSDDSPATQALAVAESLLGVAMLIMVIVSYNLEIEEHKPTEVDTLERWHTLLGYKLGQNLSASVNSALAFEGIVPANNPYKQILKFTKFFSGAAETGFGIYLAKTALEDGTSDIA